MNKKKILFLVNHDVVIYNFRKEIVKRLISDGHTVVVSSPYGERIDDLIEMGCDYQEIKINRHGTNAVNDLKIIRSYLDLLRQERPDYVFTFTIKPNIYGGIACSILNIPFASNITGLGSAVENPGLLQKITTMLYKKSFKKVKTVFFQNEENMSFFKDKGIAIDKHKLLPGSGVNLKEFSYHEINDSPSTKFIFISRIMKEKGILQYLEAAQYIKSRYQNVEFHICGFCEEDFENMLIELEEKNIIVYHGMLKDVREIIRNTHCTVHPTYYPEGLSNVLLESAAMGRPLIATDRSGCREVINNNENGFLIKSKDTHDLIEKIELFLALDLNRRKEMGEKSRKLVEDKFDRQIVIEEYMKLIK